MAISVGSVAVDVVPDASTFATRLRAALLPEATRIGDDVGKTISDRIVAKIRDGLPRGIAEGARGASAAGGKAGEDFGGSFARMAKARIDAALRDLPKPRVGVDATELDAKLAEIRARMAALGDVRIGVDLTAEEAFAEIDRLRVDLAVLGARSPDINVRVDAAAAAAELAAIQAEADKLDGKDVNIDVNDHGSIAGAEAGLGGLATAGIALGPAIIPVAAAVAAAIAGIGAAAFAAVGGLGVLLLGFSGISGAVKELGQSQEATGASAARSAAQQVSAAASIASAEQQVADAHRGVADAERAATQSVQQALARQQDAENTLAAAQRTARQAQLDLSAARKQAKQDLEDLTLQVQDGALAQRQANLDVQVARQNLNKVLMDPTATALQRQQAQLSYDQAVQQVTDLAVRQRRLQEQQQEAAKAGVNGSAGVLSATQRVSDAETALAKARRDAAAAQDAVVEAQRASAERILVAQERVVAAERQLQVAQAQQAASAQASATSTRKAFDALSPAGQRLATFIAGTLIPQFHKLRDAAQSGLLPGLQRGLESLLPLMPAFTKIVGALASTMGNLFAEAAQALNAPFWRQFFGWLASTMGPNLAIFVHTMENFGKGFAGLFQAFGPVAQQVGLGVLHLSEAFARFGATASTNPAFQRFLAYLQEVGPKVVATLGSLFRALGHIAEALAPIGVVSLAVIKVFADLIAKIPTKDLTDLAVAIIGVVVALQVAGAVMSIVSAGPVALIIAGIALLALGLMIAWNHSKTFRDVVTAVFRAVVAAAKWLGDGFVILGKDVAAFFRGMAAVSVGFVNGIIAVWDHLKSSATGAWHWISQEFGKIVSFFGGLRGRFDRAAQGMWDGIKNAFKDAVNWIIRGWNDLQFSIDIPKSVFGIPIPGGGHGITIGTPDIPYLASGGVATAATLGVVGEAGREAILPLDNPATMRMLRDALLGGPHAAGAPLVGHLELHDATPQAVDRIPAVLRRTAFEMGWATG